MKIIKEQILETDIKAFRGRQSFTSGFKLPLKETVNIPDKEYSLLSDSMRKLEGHFVSALLPYLDTNFICKAEYQKITIQADIFEGKVSLSLYNKRNDTYSRLISLNEAKDILNSEVYLLFYIQQNAMQMHKNAELLTISQKEQEHFHGQYPDFE